MNGYNGHESQSNFHTFFISLHFNCHSTHKVAAIERAPEQHTEHRLVDQEGAKLAMDRAAERFVAVNRIAKAKVARTKLAKNAAAARIFAGKAEEQPAPSYFKLI